MYVYTYNVHNVHYKCMEQKSLVKTQNTHIIISKFMSLLGVCHLMDNTMGTYVLTNNRIDL